MNFLWFKKQKKRMKNWWENNQERVKDELVLVIVIPLIIILSPILIMAIIIILIMAIEIDIAGLKRIFKKFTKRLRECAKEIAFYCNTGFFPPMSKEDIEEILKIKKPEE